MFFSISMPVYNAENYLNKSIGSVMRQTEQDFELILVNDGSKDNSLSICYEWQKKYPNIIRVIDKENSGSLFTRRVCLKESKGHYLYIMDADDYLTDSNMLKIIKEKIVEFKSDLLLFNSSKDENNVSSIFKFPFKKDNIIEDKNKIYNLLLTSHCLNPLWDKVFSRNLVDWEIDYSDYKCVTHATDAFQSLPILVKANRILYLDNVFYHYTIEENSQSIVHTYKKTIYDSFKERHKRLSDLSKSWHNIEQKDLLIKNSFMNDVKEYYLRTLKVHDNNELLKLYRTISEDSYFRKNYNLKGNTFFTKIIVSLFYHKRIYILMYINPLLKYLNISKLYYLYVRAKKQLLI